MSGKRILVVSDEMEVGGSQRQIVRLLLGLKSRGVDVSLLYFRKPSFLLDAVVEAGIPVKRIDKRSALDPRFLAALWRFLRRGRFDLVHAFSITAEVWVRLALYGVPGTRLVSSIRGLGLDDPAWTFRAKRWIAAGSAGIISNSAAGADLVAQRSAVPRERIDVVPNAVDLPEPIDAARRAAAREALDLPAGQPLVAYVGRLVGFKNIGLLLRALARLPEARRPWLWIAGDGPERGFLEGLCDELALRPWVRFLGERKDAAVLMQAADLLASSSRDEGMSNSILEAMSHGLPVVATAVGGSPELITDNESGLLVPNEDEAALAAALDRMLGDAELRHRLGAGARETIERRFASGAMVESTLSIYRRCLDGAPA
ncbi:glycosyltransferase [Pseudomarimonas salicorniae]|uniref:Glycosyltransferase n=1 Tax=Pseudomarimonas salicorniae TaxID=2933270 RepID=A0ABT0GI15_9GAMM|nr:glycosyltransferase [Lysobacter sp. CAU 1642]MCK7593987.1 glycosyltransferase [Lysobacter sp. CAU 1642]